MPSNSIRPQDWKQAYNEGAMRYVLILAATAACWAGAVKIVPKGGGFELQRDGKPYYILGAGGTARMELLKQSGGNSVRTWSPPRRDVLDQCARLGLTVLVGLEVGKPRHGFDYGDPAQVDRQRARVRATVGSLKSHPAVLMWALGNETELLVSDAERVALWKEIEQLARIVRQEDPSRPVITVLAGLGKSKLRELEDHCPTLDAVGINAYGGMMQVPEQVAAQGWRKAYIVTEFGPRGHWEVAKTPWGLPIEDSSTEKAAFYSKAYAHAVKGQPQCLGSYVFLWGQKQEKTHTWYGMFLPDGTPLDTVDAMTRAWTGSWPADRAPAIRRLTVEGSGVHRPGARIAAKVDAMDPEGGPLKVEWDLRRDVSDNPATGGDREPPTPPIEGAIAAAQGMEATVELPEAPGNYRLFVYVRDGSGKAATANCPLRVE